MIKTNPLPAEQRLQNVLQLVRHGIIRPVAPMLVKPRRKLNRRIRVVRPRTLIPMMPLAMPARLPRTIRPLVTLAAPSMPPITIILIPITNFTLALLFLRRSHPRGTLGRKIKLHRLLVRARYFRLVYTIWQGVSTGVSDMGRQRPRPTTCSSEQVLVAGSVRDWSTHIVIGTSGLAVICVVLLLWRWTGVRVAGIHVVVGWLVDEA
jgi:hypothetical protein